MDLDNTPSGDHLDSTLALFENIMQPIRDEFGPITITSGYRSDALNEAIGGSKRSQHSKGQACDFERKGVSNKDVASWIQENLDFDQLILEFFDEDDINSGWIHCSHTTGSNRGQVLLAVKEGGKTVYKNVEGSL